MRQRDSDQVLLGQTLGGKGNGLVARQSDAYTIVLSAELGRGIERTIRGPFSESNHL